MASLHYEAREASCILQGNEELYGLGVRVGLYIQFLITIIAAIKKDRYLAQYRDASLIFTLACFIAIVRQTKVDELYDVEVVIMISLLVTQLIVTFLLMEASFGFFVSLCLTYAINLFYIWFFFKGLDSMKKPSCKHAWAWLLRKVDLRGWYRGTMKLYLLDGIIESTVLMLWKYFKSDDPGDFSAGYNYVIFRCLITFPFSVAAAEMTIRYNHIIGVQTLKSSGQLIPFLFAVGQLVHMVYSIVTRGKTPEIFTPRQRDTARKIVTKALLATDRPGAAATTLADSDNGKAQASQDQPLITSSIRQDSDQTSQSLLRPTSPGYPSMSLSRPSSAADSVSTEIELDDFRQHYARLLERLD